MTDKKYWDTRRRREEEDRPYNAKLKAARAYSSAANVALNITMLAVVIVSVITLVTGLSNNNHDCVKALDTGLLALAVSILFQHLSDKIRNRKVIHHMPDEFYREQEKACRDSKDHAESILKHIMLYETFTGGRVYTFPTDPEDGPPVLYEDVISAHNISALMLLPVVLADMGLILLDFYYMYML